MSLTLADLLADRRQITVQYAGHEVSVTYQPSVYTAEMSTQLSTIPTSQFVAKLVSEWDVLDDDGTPLPITPETTATLPIRFLGIVSSAILKDVNQGEAEGS